MSIKQINLILENIPGSLSELCSIVESMDLQIYSLSTTTQEVKNPVKMIVDGIDKVVNELKKRNYEIEVIDILAVEVPMHPGGLNSILKQLAEQKINIISIYPILPIKSNNAVVALETDNIKEAEKVLKQGWIKLIDIENI